MSLPPETDDDPPLTLAPTDPETDAVRQRMRSLESPRLRPLSDPPPMAVPWQFTLGQLILANSLIAVVLAMCQVFAPGLLAGALGLVAFVLFTFVTVYQPEQQEVYTVAWGMIGVYLLVAAIALLRG
jgi:hypothetical protein